MKRALIGGGGFAREIKSHIGDPKIKCFVDDEYWKENDDYIFPLSKFDPKKYKVIVAIGDPKDRFDMIQRLPKDTKYFKFIHPSAQILGKDTFIGEGSIICAGCILTTNITIGKHAHLNLQTTIGHDCRIKVSGNCKIYDCVYVGTNASIKEKISIHSLVTIGMNGAVVKHIEEPGTYVGVPVKKLK